MAKEKNREMALAALLNTSTVVEAAAKCKVSQQTIYRYLREPEFLGEYKAMRRQIVDQAIARVQGLTGEALDALRRNLTCGTNPSVEVRAAQIILDSAMKGVETTDILDRLEVLEKGAAQNE